MALWELKRDVSGCIFVISFVLAIALHPASAAEIVFGMQLNDDAADSYGSSMAYDAQTHRLYVTGGTYGRYFQSGVSKDQQTPSDFSDCFFGVLQLPQQVFMSPQWIRRVQIGMSDVSEACSALYVSRMNGDIYLLGHSVHSSSILSPLTPTSQQFYHPSASGLIMHLNRGASLLGGMMMRANAVQYPIAIQGDQESRQLFIASVKSDTKTINPSFEQMTSRTNATHLDMTTAGYLPPQYGENFTIIFESLQQPPQDDDEEENGPGFDKAALKETLEPVWTREFGLDMHTSVYVSSLLYLSRNMLVMAGSVHGRGFIKNGNGNEDHDDDGGNWDGFVVVIDSQTGDQLRSQRVRSVPNHDDRVLSVCQQSKIRSNTTSDIYMVGISEGSIDYYGKESSQRRLSYRRGAYRAFLLRMNAETMETKWVSYMGATYEVGKSQGRPPQVHGMACAVTSDGQEVYMAGTVKDGALLDPDPANTHNVDAKSHGGDDIFVAQYKAQSGKLNYAIQLGTSHDDTLGQGDSIVANESGDAIILGNTRGSLMRRKSSPFTSDMFILSLARKRGRHLPFYDEMMNLGPVATYEGFSKSTNPYYFDAETDRSHDAPEPVQAINGASNADAPNQGENVDHEFARNETIPPATLAPSQLQRPMSVLAGATVARPTRANSSKVDELVENTTKSELNFFNGSSPDQAVNTTIKSELEFINVSSSEQVQNKTILPEKQTTDVPRRPHEQPSYQAESSGAIDYSASQNPPPAAVTEEPGNEIEFATPLTNSTPDPEQQGPVTAETNTPTHEIEAARPLTRDPISEEQGPAGAETNSPTTSFPSPTTQISTSSSPNLRTMAPSDPPPFDEGILIESDASKNEKSTGKAHLPYIIALILLINIILVVGMVWVCFRSRKPRVLPGLADSNSKAYREESSVEDTNASADVRVMVGEGRWKPGFSSSEEESSVADIDLEEESDASSTVALPTSRLAVGFTTAEDESETSSVLTLPTSGSRKTVDGAFLMEMKPTRKKEPLETTEEDDSFCQSLLWDRGFPSHPSRGK
jgi:hypothetical protein